MADGRKNGSRPLTLVTRIYKTTSASLENGMDIPL